MNLRRPKFSPPFPFSSRPITLSTCLPILLPLAFSASLSSLSPRSPFPHLFPLVICSPSSPPCSFSFFPLPPLLLFPSCLPSLSFPSSFPPRFSFLFFPFSVFLLISCCAALFSLLLSFVPSPSPFPTFLSFLFLALSFSSLPFLLLRVLTSSFVSFPLIFFFFPPSFYLPTSALTYLGPT